MSYIWGYIIDFAIVIIAFYFFCICSAHVFMYKPDLNILNQFKRFRSSFLFSIIGIGILSLFNKIHIPERWRNPIYLFIFLFCAASTFAFLLTTIYS